MAKTNSSVIYIFVCWCFGCCRHCCCCCYHRLIVNIFVYLVTICDSKSPYKVILIFIYFFHSFFIFIWFHFARTHTLALTVSVGICVCVRWVLALALVLAFESDSIYFVVCDHLQACFCIVRHAAAAMAAASITHRSWICERVCVYIWTFIILFLPNTKRSKFNFRDHIIGLSVYSLDRPSLSLSLYVCCVHRNRFLWKIPKFFIEKRVWMVWASWQMRGTERSCCK